jgi:hypothetical protein
MLPTFDGGESFWDFLTARMRLYMTHLMSKGWKQQWFYPNGGNVILLDQVARMFGCQQCWLIRGFPSVDDSWSTRCPIDAIAPLKECMPRDAFSDMFRCIHFLDNFDDREEWSEIFFGKKHVLPNTARHRRKFVKIEDAINHRWKECATAGMAMTHDGRIAGWYKSEITCRPEPKPIRTGATLHSMAMSFSPLTGYKLHARTFVRKNDSDLGMVHKNCASIQKWINLISLMLKDYKGQGRYMTMDSAYMGDIMAQVGREVWGMNMVGTVQCNRSGADTTETTKKMKPGTYDSVMWQHNNKPLMFAAWGDNSVVKTLSNCHGPEVLAAGVGVNWKRRCNNGKRERVSMEVPCPAQMKYYCQTFHLIDKGNGAEETYDMGGKSRTHNWSPKIIFWLINMTMANAYQIYCTMVTERTYDCKCLSMKDTIKEETFALMQRGAPMRTREALHPQPEIDLSRLHGCK